MTSCRRTRDATRVLATFGLTHYAQNGHLTTMPGPCPHPWPFWHSSGYRHQAGRCTLTTRFEYYFYSQAYRLPSKSLPLYTAEPPSAPDEQSGGG